MALMGEDYNGYKYRKQEYDDFVAFKNGTYAPYRVPEKAEQKPPHTFTSKFSKAAEKKLSYLNGLPNTVKSRQKTHRLLFSISRAIFMKPLNRTQ